MNKNTKLIAIVSAVIVVLLIVIIALFAGGKNSNDTTNNGTGKANAQSVKPIKVIKENGSQDKVSKANLKVRKVKFGTKYKDVLKFEKKQDDTLDKYSEASSKDGYTYVSYKFNPKKTPKFWDVKPSADDTMSMLTYVFFNKRLIELRIQYGAVDANAINKAVAAATKEFGKTTYDREYDNGCLDYWWKTKKATLRIMKGDAKTNTLTAYFSQNR